MTLEQGIILGILQGLTEFLPVSSSGHLVLGQLLFGLKEAHLVFDISVHMGTLLAVLVVYRRQIRDIIVSVFRFAGSFTGQSEKQFAKDDRKNLNMAAAIIIGSVPTALIGLFLKQYEHTLFSSGLLVGFMLLCTGMILWLSRKFYFSGQKDADIPVSKSILIGISQGLAVMPGISRSGTTIAAGMFLGMDRAKAATFSFLLSVPAIMGAQILSIKDMLEQGGVIDSVTLWATLVSFITGLVALKILLRIVNAGRFHLFAPYCWLLGIAAIVIHFIH